MNRPALPLGFDEARLGDYLAGALDGFARPFRVERIVGGQSNPTFIVETRAAKYILRKKPPGDLLPSAHAVEREYRVMKALKGRAPVPNVRLLCEDVDVIGTPFYVMDFIEGRVFRDNRLPGMSPAERVAIYDAMGDALAALHRVDYAEAGLADYGKPKNFVRRQIALWTRQFEASKTHDIPAMDRLMEWLPEHATDEDETGIAHGDFRLENMIFHPTEPRPLAIIDWELSTLGHPLCDLAYNCMTYHLPNYMIGCGGLADVDIAALGLPDESSYVARYCRLMGREPIANWPFFMAFSMFRSAAIVQGVYKRALQNNAANSNAREIGLYATPVSEIAWKIAEAHR
jgi:aminoglycoside phosphotransferase (APT) family kinase protein